MKQNGFVKFTFSPISFEQFSGHFLEKYSFAQISIYDAYLEWLESYTFRAFRFYQSQYGQHEKIEYANFRKEYDFWESDSPGAYGLGDAWDQWRIETGLDDHQDSLDSYTPYRRNQDDVLPDILKDIDEIKSKGKPTEREVDEFWFNVTIKNTAEETDSLRRIQYPQYLNTHHWKRVRAAVLLIYKARCQEESCYLSGDSWYGGNWETDIHVHHLSYTNKGNERYSDITLLCNNHHDLWHKNQKQFGEPKIKIVTPIVPM